MIYLNTFFTLKMLLYLKAKVYSLLTGLALVCTICALMDVREFFSGKIGLNRRNIFNIIYERKY